MANQPPQFPETGRTACTGQAAVAVLPPATGRKKRSRSTSSRTGLQDTAHTRAYLESTTLLIQVIQRPAGPKPREEN